MRTREEQIAAIRELADWLEANPDIPVPWHLNGSGYVSIHASHVSDQKGLLVTFTRALPGKVTKSVFGEGSTSVFEVEGRTAGGIKIGVIAARDEVCERVVVGTREVTEEVPAPDAPMVSVTRTVEDVEWRCGPLLAERS